MDKYPVSSAYRRDPVSKNYNEIVFRPHPSQSSELNDLQLILNHRLQSYIETLYKDGDVITGGYSNLSDNTVFFFDTTVYIRGQILSLDANSIKIKGVGEELAGILYEEEYITANEDIDLLDPAINTSNFRKRGADRVRYKTSWAVDPKLEDNMWFYPICSLDDGEITRIFRLPVDNSILNNQLAEYDYSTKGSYIVDGVNLYYHIETSSNYIIGITSGSVRVNGKAVTIPHNTSVGIRKSTDTRSFISEPLSYSSGNIYYKSRHTPIKSIERVLAQQTVEEDIIHRYHGSIDELTYNPIIKVNEITMPERVFAQGIDYIVSGDGIQWLTDNQPSAGSQYHISYNYFTEITGKISFGKENVTDTIPKFIIPESASIPDGTLVTIDYTIYLSRKDTISVSSDGVIIVSEGNPVENNPKAGVPSPSNLILGTVEVSPNGENPIVLSTDQRVVKVTDQRQSISKLEECEYNISRLGLLMSLSSHQPSSLLRSNFVDPLQNENMMDSALSVCSVSDGYLGMKINWGQRTVDNLPVVSPYIEETVLSQLKSTKSRQVNEFLVLSGNTVSVSAQPATYYFVVDYIRTNVYGSQATTTTVNEAATGIYDVPNHNISLSASGLIPNEDVKIYIADAEYLVQSDSNGNVSESIESPEMKSGTTQITVEGVDSGRRGVVSYAALPVVQHQYVVTTPPPTVINYNTYNTYNISNTYITNVTSVQNNSDPLAQTFILNESRDVTSVELFFTQRPTTNAFVMVTQTTGGMPDPTKTLGISFLTPSSINVDGNSTKFTFSNPLPIEANQVYAVIIGCDDGDARIRVAELGKMDLDSGGVISQNVYNAGTLLQASQLNTWSPIQSEDAKIIINAAKYNSNSYSKDVGTVSVSSISDIMIMPVEYIPSDSTVSIDVDLKATNNQYSLSVATPLTIRSYSGDIGLTYSMESVSTSVSPIFYSCQIGIGQLVNPSYYISREFATGSGSTLFVYLTSVIPSTCSVKIYYLSNRNDINSWVEMNTNDPRYPSQHMGNNWIERTYLTENFPQDLQYTRIKVEMYTADTSQRPYCVDLRATFV